MKCKHCGENLDGGLFGIGSKCVNPMCTKGEFIPIRPIKKEEIKIEEPVVETSKDENCAPLDFYSPKQKLELRAMSGAIEKDMRKLLPSIKIISIDIMSNQMSFDMKIKLKYQIELDSKCKKIEIDATSYELDFFFEIYNNSFDEHIESARKIMVKLEEKIATEEGLIYEFKKLNRRN